MSPWTTRGKLNPPRSSGAHRARGHDWSSVAVVTLLTILFGAALLGVLDFLPPLACLASGLVAAVAIRIIIDRDTRRRSN